MHPHAGRPTPESTDHHVDDHDVSPRTTPPSTSPLPPVPIADNNTASLRGGARSDRHNQPTGVSEVGPHQTVTLGPEQTDRARWPFMGSRSSAVAALA